MNWFQRNAREIVGVILIVAIPGLWRLGYEKGFHWIIEVFAGASMFGVTLALIIFTFFDKHEPPYINDDKNFKRKWPA